MSGLSPLGGQPAGAGVGALYTASAHGAESCIATGSGLSAVAAVLGAHAGAGRHVLIHEGVYGPTRTLCEQELPTWGTRVQFFDDAASLEAAITPDTSLIYIEVPTSLTMRMLDVKAVCTIARARGIPVACDASWGTPVFFDAHGLGIDIAVHAGTKFINGHSDVMLGLLTGSQAAMGSVRRWCDRFGTHASADSCWLTMRGLRTLALRLEAHQAGALVVAEWLQHHPAVKRVLYPALASDPGHALWRRHGRVPHGCLDAPLKGKGAPEPRLRDNVGFAAQCRGDHHTCSEDHGESGVRREVGDVQHEAVPRTPVQRDEVHDTARRHEE